VAPGQALEHGAGTDSPYVLICRVHMRYGVESPDKHELASPKVLVRCVNFCWNCRSVFSSSLTHRVYPAKRGKEQELQ
jgi:hypothetical protein